MTCKPSDSEIENEPVLFCILQASDMMDVITELRVGSQCPRCQVGILDYNGLLNLACQNCGFELSGCFT
jgi:uncharacterized protein (DUF983 family)